MFILNTIGQYRLESVIQRFYEVPDNVFSVSWIWPTSECYGSSNIISVWVARSRHFKRRRNGESSAFPSFIVPLCVLFH